MNNLISIIIPCYNSEQYLSKCLYSILCQSVESWEAICINDGSKDNTETILQQFVEKDPRIKVISQENAGVSAARNRALAECKGEFICFVDSDDTIEPDFLETLLAINLQKNDLSICNFTRDMTPTSPSALKKVTWQLEGHKCAEKILCDKSFHPQICCMLFRKEIIQRHYISFTLGCARGEDWEFFMKYLVHCNNIGYSDKKLYHYRINENSAMASFNEKSLTSLEASQRVANYYELHQSPVKEAIKKYAVSRTLWKFLIISLLRHNKIIYQKLLSTYDIKSEMRKLYDYPGLAERYSARLSVICPPLFKSLFYLLGFIYKR